MAALQGAVEGTLDGEPATLAMLQDFAANSAEGWAMALASVRDLLAEGDLRADEVGGDFAGEASRLGETVAVVHAELRAGAGRRASVTPRELAAAWHQRLDVAAAEVPELAEHVERDPRRLRRGGRARRPGADPAGARRPAPRPDPAHPLRLAGDRLRGRAARAACAERVRPDSALRDVAGMLRSFDYAAFHQLSQWEPGDEWPTRTTTRS